MFKSIARITSFSLLLFIMLYCLTYLAKPAGQNLENISGIYSLKENSLDVVNIGGSATFVYYMPLKAWKDYGIVSYDYAADTIQAELYIPLIKEILKTQNPKLVIIDARAFQYRDSNNIDSNNIDSQPPGEIPYRNTLNGMRLSKNKIDFINKYVDGEKVSYYFDLIKYHDNILEFNPVKIKLLFGKYRNPYNGFMFIPKVRSLKGYDYDTDLIKPVTRDTEDVLIELLDYIDTTGLDYLFTVSPYNIKKEHKMTFNYVQDVIESRGYKFIDCNDYFDDMGLDYSKDFYNVDHVNVFGAEKYTDFINHYIIDNYKIPNRKEDLQYSYMNDYIDAWENHLERTKREINRQINEIE